MIDEKLCWICNLIPGHSVTGQLSMMTPDERNTLCTAHYRQSLKPNPNLAMVYNSPDETKLEDK